METDSGNNIPERDGHGAVGHVPVLLKEAIDFLAVKRGGTYLDATVGLGGHSYEIAKRLGAPGHLIGFDKDPAALERAREKLMALDEPPEITLIHGSFAEVAERIAPASLDGLMADLGVSSLQLGDAARGFSFQAEGPLDMRMNPMSGETAEQVVNHLDERKLADVIYEFGEERRSRRIARAIVRSRPIRTTQHLVEVISDDLKALLEAAPSVLKPGGRLVVIGFHSLEDRIVKDALRGGKDKYFRVLTKKPLTASEEEIDRNPRSRSAKMRAAERM